MGAGRAAAAVWAGHFQAGHGEHDGGKLRERVGFEFELPGKFSESSWTGVLFPLLRAWIDRGVVAPCGMRCRNAGVRICDEPV